MNKRLVVNLSSFASIALIFCLLGLITQSEMIKWAAPSFAIALVSLGLGINSLIIALHSDKQMSKIDATLVRIETLQEEIKKDIAEQKNQKSSGVQIIPTLQGISKYMMDFINKDKDEGKK